MTSTLAITLRVFFLTKDLYNLHQINATSTIDSIVGTYTRKKHRIF